MTRSDELSMDLRRLGEREIPEVMALMRDVISRLPSQELFAMDDEAYFRDYLLANGEIYGVYLDGKLVAYTSLSFPKHSESNLGREFGVPEKELPKVACLEATVVHESVRGLGLQRRFHALRERRAIAYGAGWLYSTVHPDNASSIRNLEAAGFARRFTRPMYGGKPRHCYVKRLASSPF
ncbi:GNAT family N-acetyltransferase [Paenibacillus arenilitoris]|uniref:GNAT family N-acetyltransferase n=1 Tax=Paenibacillus arenilitoris TaxID=2772299 RepID=A0A927CNQ1_9BACL|nr:GNAT family N-acetyltransferase [Paenibacillus arenilitoris]MBD2869171.1 GNAT family N-acetyltransferase [Paenibacillus arenilitoris]